MERSEEQMSAMRGADMLRNIVIQCVAMVNVSNEYDLSGMGSDELEALVTLECGRWLRVLRKDSNVSKLFASQPVPAIIEKVEVGERGEQARITYRPLNKGEGASLETIWTPWLESALGREIKRIAEENIGETVSIMKHFESFRNNPDRGMSIAQHISIDSVSG